jgi:hypothetical protein
MAGERSAFYPSQLSGTHNPLPTHRTATSSRDWKLAACTRAVLVLVAGAVHPTHASGQGLPMLEWAAGPQPRKIRSGRSPPEDEGGARVREIAVEKGSGADGSLDRALPRCTFSHCVALNPCSPSRAGFPIAFSLSQVRDLDAGRLDSHAAASLRHSKLHSLLPTDRLARNPWFSLHHPLRPTALPPCLPRLPYPVLPAFRGLPPFLTFHSLPRTKRTVADNHGKSA